jgi:hypothetical protein
MKINHEFACFVAGLSLFAPAASQAASGAVDIVLSATPIAYSVQMGDTTVTASGGDGTLRFIRSSGRPFVEGASATVQYASFSKNTPSGLEFEADGVATFSSEDTLFLLFERRSADTGTSGEGTLRLTGGSGRFAGVSGQCRYKMDNVPGRPDVTTAKCEWLYSFPYR